MIKMEFNKYKFLRDSVDEFIEVVEEQNPEGFTQEYKNNAFKFFDRMIIEYKLREAI